MMMSDLMEHLRKVKKQAAEIERLEARIKCDHAILQGAKKAMVEAVAEIEKTALIMLEQAKALDKLLHDIERLRAALESIVGQTNDQYFEGVWREVNSTAIEALKENERCKPHNWRLPCSRCEALKENDNE
jgi:hypothetical protein